MTELNLFERATRDNFTFDSNRGALSVQDLWDLPLISTKHGILTLDQVAQTVNHDLQQTKNVVSFVKPEPKADQRRILLENKLEVVKRIIEVKIAERDAAALQAQRNKEIQELMGLIDQKEGEERAAIPLEELRARLSAMQSGQ
jgi:transcriptional regulator of NAD metabolism